MLTVTAVRGYTNWAGSNATEWTTTWKATWDIVWHHLVMQALQRFPSEDISLPLEVDPWLSTLHNFSFRVQKRTVTWNSPIITPILGQMAPSLAVWLMLRRRLIAAHQQPGNRVHRSSHQVQKFLYLLGLEKLLQAVQNSPIVQPPLKRQTTQRGKEFKSGKHKFSSSEIAQQNFLWEQES